MTIISPVVVGLIDAKYGGVCPGCEEVLTTNEWAEHWLLACPQWEATRQKLLHQPISLVPFLGGVGCPNYWANPRGEGGCILAAKLCGAIMPRALAAMWTGKTDKASAEDIDGVMESDQD